MSRKRPGRPSLDRSGVPTADVHLTLRADMYDRVHQIAKDKRKSIQDLIRDSLHRLLTDERGGHI